MSNINELKKGMIFLSLRELCDFLEIEYRVNRITRIKGVLSKSVKIKNITKWKFIIEDIDYEKFNLDDFKNKRVYKYNIGDKVESLTGYIEIIDKIMYESKRGYLCKCCNDGYEFKSTQKDILDKKGCPACKNKAVIVGSNDINTTNPEISSLLYCKSDGEKYTISTDKRLRFICPKCKEEKYLRPIDVLKTKGVTCHCRKTNSYPNKVMYNLLNSYELNFESEKVFEWSNDVVYENRKTKKRYDYYVEKYNCIIEVNGKQHYDESCSLRNEIKNDEFKNKLAMDNGIINYYSIDCSISDISYIKNSVEKSGLLGLLNIKDVDWNSIDKLSNRDIYDEVVELYNKYNKDVASIIENSNIGRDKIRYILKLANENGDIIYNKEIINKIAKEKSLKSYYQNNSKPICLDEKIFFGSISLLRDYILNNIERSSLAFKEIKQVLLNEKDSLYGYKIQYTTREEFNYNKLNNPDNTYGDLFEVC